MTFRFTLSVFLLTLFVLTANAATDEFTVRTLIGSDTTPPTIPTGLVAVPVATSQIDLSWSSSTDDLALAGYQVFRDNTQIATTVSPLYSDVGLTAATLYSYYVTAFDGAGNISASSTVVSTTTLAPPPPPPPPTPAQSSRIIQGIGEIDSLELLNLEVTPATTSATITFQTKGHVNALLRWGETTSYELGSIKERSFRQHHEVHITDLSPGTKYYFRIEGEGPRGDTGIITESTFRTLTGIDQFAPANVEQLRAFQDGDDIVLTWKNPSDPDFAGVRVLVNDQFYPIDFVDGSIVAEGVIERARDSGSAIPGTTRYYSVFAYDENGNISSGAIVAIRITEAGVILVDPSDRLIEESDVSIQIDLNDFQFIQEDAQLKVVDQEVKIDGTKLLIILLPYDKVPEHLKSILVTVYEDRTRKQQFSFLLRINEAKTAYTATIAPFGRSGFFPFAITLFDFKTESIWSEDGVFNSTIIFRGGAATTNIRIVWSDRIVLFIITLILLLLIAYRLVRGRYPATS